MPGQGGPPVCLRIAAGSVLLIQDHLRIAPVATRCYREFRGVVSRVAGKFRGPRWMRIVWAVDVNACR